MLLCFAGLCAHGETQMVIWSQGLHVSPFSGFALQGTPVHGEQRVSEHGGIQSYVLRHTFFQPEFFIKGTLDFSQLVTKLGLDS